MAEIRTRQLGLAAFIQMQGMKLLRVEKYKEFIFESEKSEAEWQVLYSNSCCSLHDALVCQLRHHLQRKGS
jgi:hypothetical protein